MAGPQTHNPITRSPDHQITRYYKALFSRYGPQNWWPAESRFEVIVGAYLTQNTNWGNVEKAIANLREARVLSLKAMREIPVSKLEKLVRPSGFFRQKARKLKAFIVFLDNKYSGSLARMFAQPTEKLRAELLELNGVGPETADSILLYAGNHPVFVVDAYARRVLERHGMITAKKSYEEIRAMIEGALGSAGAGTIAPAENTRSLRPTRVLMNAHARLTAFGMTTGHRGVIEEAAVCNDPRHPVSRMSRSQRSNLAQHYNELHALIVRVGNQYCRSTAECEGCPLEKFLLARHDATTGKAPES